MHDDLASRIKVQEITTERVLRTLHGDLDNPLAAPGLIASHRRVEFEQNRTNEILEEVRNDLKDVRGDLRKINWMFIALIVAAVGNAIFKG
jgi:hypothetical protein